MGEVEINTATRQIAIHSRLFFYGDAANESISSQVATDIADHWNECNGKIMIKKRLYEVVFDIEGYFVEYLTPEMVFENVNPRNNFFRVEVFAHTDVSFVDGVNSNTGYFKLDNLLNNSGTAAHEYGHSIGLDHPKILDIRGKGRPGIMYPRGTIVDPQFQYNPAAAPLQPGGTMNPFTRKVLQEDVDNLNVKKLDFNQEGFAVLGGFTSQWHDKHLQ